MPQEFPANKCFVHADARGSEKRRVNEKVCKDLQVKYRVDGDKNSYCVLHCPTTDKSDEFKAVYDERTETGEYNFQWVYFPGIVFLADKTIDGPIDFSNAEFTQDVYFTDNVIKGHFACHSAVFAKSVRIKSVEFAGYFSFNGSLITGDLSMADTVFRQKSDFHHIKVHGAAWISANTYEGPADFEWARFFDQAHFDSSKFDGEASFISARFLNESFFHNAVFKASARFDGVTFTGYASFREAVFEFMSVFDGATFLKTADFTEAEVRDFAHFSGAKFAIADTYSDDESGGYFVSCRFTGFVSFDGAEFRFLSLFSSEFSKTIYARRIKVLEDANLTGCDFAGEVLLTGSTFDKTLALRFSRFQKSLIFNRDNECKVSIGMLDIQHADLDNPSKVYFHTVNLRPHWFVNTNCKQFVFTACTWRSADGYDVDTVSELSALAERGIPDPNKLLIQTCWQLADNFEDTKGFSDASLFRRVALEAEQLARKEESEKWRRKVAEVFTDDTECSQIASASGNRMGRLVELFSRRNRPYDLIHFLYHSLSGFGEDWSKALVWLFVIWIVFAVSYWALGSFGNAGGGGETIGFLRSFGYSLQVMTLQRPDPRPFSALTTILYGVETVLAPAQAALLALAIRRKFMR